MSEFDVIITLVGSPGANMEAGIIATNPTHAKKSQMFMDAAHTNGLVAEGCRLAEEMGAFFKEYRYPEDLTDCHLLGYVMERIKTVQMIKYLS